MSIIVDGYNYIGRSRRGLRLHDPKARDAIISLFGQYCRRARKSLTIVFDGTYSVSLANRKRKFGRVTVIYTSPTVSADDVIKQMIRARAHGKRQGLLIVTSDNDIAQCAQAHNAAWIKSEAFERTVQQALDAPQPIDRKHVQLSPDEVQEWMDFFGAADDVEEARTIPTDRRGRYRLPQKPPAPPKPSPPKPDSQPAAPDDEQPERISRRRPIPAPSPPRNAPTPITPPDELDRINVHLSENDVDAWLKIFHDAEKTDDAESDAPAGKRRRTPKRRS